jgi:uncharacterized protein (DUF362 family)
MNDRGVVFIRDFTDWRDSVRSLLDRADLLTAIGAKRQVLIKPNLVENFPPPITTPVGLVEAIVKYLQERDRGLRIIIGEGTGSRDYDTFHPFRELGYVEMAARCGVTLLDLNEETLRTMRRAECQRWPEMHLPEILFESFLLSVPVLKAHSLASVTLTMKNMMGCAPPAHYEKGGHWKKSAFHANVQEAILDLNRYRTPDFTVLDATVGMQEAHLWGPTCNPPHRKLAAGRDPVAIDVYGAGLLGRDWRRIDHLAKAHRELGLAEPLALRMA